MKQYYDAGRHTPTFTNKAYLRLSKKSEAGYHLQNQAKLSFDKVGPFEIIRPVGILAYEIQLPDWLSGIHSIISIDHLEAYHQDPYERPAPDPGPIQVHGEDRFIVEKILDKELRKVKGMRTRQPFYLVKWHGQQDTSWELGS
jgi:hypothetical protein